MTTIKVMDEAAVVGVAEAEGEARGDDEDEE